MEEQFLRFYTDLLIFLDFSTSAVVFPLSPVVKTLVQTACAFTLEGVK